MGPVLMRILLPTARVSSRQLTTTKILLRKKKKQKNSKSEIFSKQQGKTKMQTHKVHEGNTMLLLEPSTGALRVLSLTYGLQSQYTKQRNQ